MKALKGIMMYIGIVLLSIVVISALVIGLMFFTKMNLFGFYFVRAFENSQYVFQEGLEDSITTVNLNIITNNYGVVVEPTSSDAIFVSTDNQYVGLLKDKGIKDKDGKIVPNLLPSVNREVENNGDNTVKDITIKIVEPEGLLSISDMSVLRVQVPFVSNGDDKNAPVKYNINIKTGNGHIDLKNNVDEHDKFLYPLNANSLTLETKRGDVKLVGLGTTKANENANNILNLTDLNIKTNGGTFDFTSFEEVKVANKVVLDSEKANYEFKKLIACSEVSGNTYSGTGGIEINGTVVKLNADMIICGSDGFIFKTETGVLKVKHLLTGEFKLDGSGDSISVVKPSSGEIIPYENTIFTDSAVVEIENIVGKLGLYDEFGEVKIGVLSNQATMRTENGGITITKSGVYYNKSIEESIDNFSQTSSMILYSTYGDILVNEYYQDAVIYSKKGKIEAHSKYETSKTDRYYYTDISTKDGKITATTEKNPIKIYASGSGNVNLEVEKILTIAESYDATTKTYTGFKNPFGKADMYQAVSQNGTVEVTLPLKSYKIKVTAKRKLEGSVGATTSFGDDYVQINNASDVQPTILVQGNRVKLTCSV